MEIKKKADFITLILIIVVILTILLINHFKEKINPEEDIIKCIAEKSVLYVSKTCSHCAQQKLLFGEDIKYFELVDCIDDSQKCAEDIADERGRYIVPTWIINGQKYLGVRQINDLKELAGC